MNTVNIAQGESVVVESPFGVVTLTASFVRKAMVVKIEAVEVNENQRVNGRRSRCFVAASGRVMEANQ